MKKTPTKKVNRYEARNDWKNEAAEHVLKLLENIDDLGLPEETVKQLEKLVAEFKEDLNLSIEQFNITPEIIASEDQCLENLLDAIYFKKVVIGEYDIDRIINIAESNRKGMFVLIENLAQEIRLEQFIDELIENPCQLKLI